MKKNQFNKGVVVLLALVMIFNVSVFAGSNDYFIVSGLKSTSGNINEGDVFIYDVTLTKAKSGDPDISNVKIQISGDVSLVGGGEFDFGSVTGVSQTKSIALKNNGTGNRINMYIYGDGGKNIVENVIIDGLMTSSSGGPPDTDNYFPNFSINTDTLMPVFYAGQKKTFKFNIENVSSYLAKNVTVKFNANQDSPFDEINSVLASSKFSLNSKKEKEITFELVTKSNVMSGFYTVPLTIEYQNLYGVSKSITKNLQIEVINDHVLPSVVISDIKIKDVHLSPGSEDVILFQLKNLGTLDIKNMNVKLEGISMDTITLNADTAEKQLALIAAKETGFVTYNVNIAEKLTKDQLELKLKCSYYDENGTKYEQDVPVYLDILQKGGDLYDYNFKVTSKPNTVSPGTEFKVNFDITNDTAVAQDLKVSLTSTASFVMKTQPITIVRDMQPGETRSFSYTVIADKSMTSNNYPLYANIQYLSDDSIVRKEYLGVFVDGEGNNNSKPKIIVDDYDFGKEVVLAGETFDLSMTFFNTSNTMGIQNAKVSISSDEGAFVPVDAASSFYIEKIGVKEKVTYVMTFKAKSDLNVKTYNITADIDYEDSNGNSYDKSDKPYKASEKMAIPVMQELRLEVEDINLPEFSPVFQPFEIYVEFFNMGKSPLQNTMVTTTGDFEVQDGKYFVGTFNAGSNDYYSCTIIPMAEGPQSGTITFEFEDAVGEKHSMTKEFTFEAVPMPEQTDMEYPSDFEGGGEFPMEEEKGFPWLPVSIVLAVIAIVAMVIVRRKIRKKKEMALDE